MKTIELEIDTSRRLFVDLTADLARFCAEVGDGLVNVFVPHATAGLALMETGSGSEGDLFKALEGLLPRDNRYTHAHGSRVTVPTISCQLSSVLRSASRYWRAGSR
jgi:thiamine phosphate synthase YjbQ (UPF0047 family)